MAHLADNAGIQSHSAGEHFPFIIEVIEKDAGNHRLYRVRSPEGIYYDCKQADSAEYLVRALFAERKAGRGGSL